MKNKLEPNNLDYLVVVVWALILLTIAIANS